MGVEERRSYSTRERSLAVLASRSGSAGLKRTVCTVSTPHWKRLTASERLTSQISTYMMKIAVSLQPEQGQQVQRLQRQSCTRHARVSCTPVADQTPAAAAAWGAVTAAAACLGAGCGERVAAPVAVDSQEGVLALEQRRRGCSVSTLPCLGQPPEACSGVCAAGHAQVALPRDADAFDGGCRGRRRGSEAGRWVPAQRSVPSSLPVCSSYVASARLAGRFQTLTTPSAQPETCTVVLSAEGLLSRCRACMACQMRTRQPSCLGLRARHSTPSWWGSASRKGLANTLQTKAASATCCCSCCL